LKEYECVQVNHHNLIGSTIKQWQERGWRLHSYQAAGIWQVTTGDVNHYLLFERGQD
jgi:hypothetical protein